ncbi:MAG: porin [Gammaproteobacteria bacterium]|nr:porin [Gammaproteobacteria bacterium]
MKGIFTVTLWLILMTLLMTPSAEAKQLKYQKNGVEAWARITVASQIAAWNTQMVLRDKDPWRNDASLRVNVEWLSLNALIYGLRVEYDAKPRTAEALQRDEIYAYVAGDFGRVEIGEQDGPADRLAYRAPIIGLGQIRGDFTRYVGRQALLSAYDTRDATKLIYLSAPSNGWRYGLSYAPKLTSKLDAVRARDRTIQRNAIEIGTQYQKDLGNWIGGLSGTYVTANADPITERADISSWSFGGEMRRDHLVLGAAYVWRGDSNRRTRDYNQREINIGVSWRGPKWRAALSTSRTTSSSRDYKVIGIGISMKVTRWINWRTDLVQYDETTLSRGSQQATVLLSELELRI